MVRVNEELDNVRGILGGRKPLASIHELFLDVYQKENRWWVMVEIGGFGVGGTRYSHEVSTLAIEKEASRKGTLV